MVVQPNILCNQILLHHSLPSLHPSTLCRCQSFWALIRSAGGWSHETQDADLPWTRSPALLRSRCKRCFWRRAGLRARGLARRCCSSVRCGVALNGLQQRLLMPDCSSLSTRPSICPAGPSCCTNSSNHWSNGTDSPSGCLSVSRSSQLIMTSSHLQLVADAYPRCLSCSNVCWAWLQTTTSSWFSLKLLFTSSPTLVLTLSLSWPSASLRSKRNECRMQVASTQTRTLRVGASLEPQQLAGLHRADDQVECGDCLVSFSK